MTRSLPAAMLFTLTFATTLEAQGVFRGGVDLVNFGVTVVDRKGELVTDLKAEDFEIYEDGKKQTLLHFVRGDSPDASSLELHVGLLFDTSGSMEDDLTLSRSAAIKFLNTLTQAVDITLVDFDTEVRTARYSQAEFPRLVERIRRQKAEGWTALYDALGVYLDGADSQKGRKILILYTDGGDTRSALSYSEVVDLLKASDVTVYAVGFLEHQRALDRMPFQMRLRQITELTGGQAFFPFGVKDLDEAYAGIAKEIAAQFGLGFLSTNTRADGSWRKVEVKVRRPDLKGIKIRSREGYFAPYKESDAR